MSMSPEHVALYVREAVNGLIYLGSFLAIGAFFWAWLPILGDKIQ